ncbi:MAG: hypothetical protein JO283_03925 [Bradyrhizobium sp.]|nr:hypothetical protein [Bradyrhizobium sp.]
MEFIPRRKRMLAVIALLATVAGAAIAVARPRPVTDHDLGAKWQCSRILFAVSCSHSSR